MWKHSIIADLTRQLSSKCSIEGYLDGVSALLPQIERAHNIHIGEDLSYEMLITKLESDDRAVFYETDGNIKRFPFTHNLFTFTINKTIEHPFKIAVYVFSHPKNEYSAASMLAFINRKEWFLFPATYICESAGYKFRGYYSPDALGREWNNDVICSFTHERLCVVDAAMHILDCRNVCLEVSEPPEKLNRSRIKKGKPPVCRHHVLKVAPGAVKKNVNHVGVALGSAPVHLCRGHFKHYDEDRPLFGIPGNHGRFWVQPHVRGNIKNGVVTKDYEIVGGSK